jgi:hypothetical protein
MCPEVTGCGRQCSTQMKVITDLVNCISMMVAVFL